MLVTLVRYAIVGASTWLLAKGVFDEGTAKALQSPTVITAIAAALIAAGTGAYIRLKSRFKTNVALSLPKGSDMADVDKVVDKSTMKEIASTQPNK